MRRSRSVPLTLAVLLAAAGCSSSPPAAAPGVPGDPGAAVTAVVDGTAATTAAAAAAPVAAAVAAPTSGSPATGTPGEPGRHNAITDVPGVRVGQVQSARAPYLTGDTVVYFPTMAVAGVDNRGGAPATKETDLLDPLNSNPGVNAIQLGGSSMYGLGATDGIIRWLEDRGEGVPLGPTGVAPIVPAADIYDLGRGGSIKARTTAAWGYLAAQATSAGAVRQGTVGGGTGAMSGGRKGGVGTASVLLPNGYWVGAVVVVNSAGSTVDPADCSLLAARLGIGDEFAGLRTPKRSECRASQATAATSNDDLNTTIAVVATNAPLEKAAAERLAGNAHDGLARAISPIHTLADGDTVFGVSTSRENVLQINDPADSQVLNQVFGGGADVLSRAVVKALLSATTVGTRTSYCDTYPSACAKMPQLRQWRTAGTAPEVTQANLDAVAGKLAVAPVPTR